MFITETIKNNSEGYISCRYLPRFSNVGNTVQLQGVKILNIMLLFTGRGTSTQGFNAMNIQVYSKQLSILATLSLLI